MWTRTRTRIRTTTFIIILLIVVIFTSWYLDIFKIFTIFYFISKQKKNIIIGGYLKYITFIIILIPIFINSVILYILTRKQKINIEKYSNLPTIFIKIINTLRNIINNEDLKKILLVNL